MGQDHPRHQSNPQMSVPSCHYRNQLTRISLTLRIPCLLKRWWLCYSMYEPM